MKSATQDQSASRTPPAVLRVTSSAFHNNGMIPVKYTCDGENINPPLQVDSIPEDAKSLLVIVDDADTSVTPWTHWMIWNLPVTGLITEAETRGLTGLNDFDLRHYSGPCPPVELHHYRFKVYALNCLLDIPSHTRRPRLDREIREFIIGYGELRGQYRREKRKTEINQADMHTFEAEVKQPK